MILQIIYWMVLITLVFIGMLSFAMIWFFAFDFIYHLIKEKFIK